MITRIKLWLKKNIKNIFFKIYKDEFIKSFETIAILNGTTVENMLQKAEADAQDKREQADDYISMSVEMTEMANQKYSTELAKITTVKNEECGMAKEKYLLGKKIMEEAKKANAAIGYFK